LERRAVEKVIEPRIYRAAFLPALLAAAVAMFSLESRPRPLRQALPADALFEGTLARGTVRSIVGRAPDRRAGTPGDEATARRMTATFRRFGFATAVDRFDEEGTGLVNVVGTRPGLSRRRLVVVAARDARSVPDATGSAADTAALIELARVLEGRATRRTTVLASVDGGTLGDAGARRLARRLGEDPAPIDAVVVLSNLGAPRSRGPLLVDWSNDATRGRQWLRRTASDSLRSELGDDGGGPGSSPAQVSRLAFPVGDGAQGVLIEAGLPAIRLSGSGELAPAPSQRDLDDVHAERYGDLGRSALRLLSALDAGTPPERGPRSYVTVAGRVAPGWALALLAIALILPAAVASTDAFARARRRGEPVVPWLRWLAAGIVPFVVGLGVAELLVLVGLADDAPAAPLDPGAAEVDGSAVGVLAATIVAIALTWAAVRPRLVGRVRGAPLDASAPGAGVALALVLCGFAVATWAVNPYAALAAILPLHLWTLAVLLDVRARTRAWLTVAGLLPAAAIVATYAQHLSLGPLHGAWYLFLLVTGHHVGLASALLGCVALGTLASVTAVVLAHARRRTPRPAGRPSRGRPSDDRPIVGPAGPPLERVRR
jgi:hypothetical protein